MQKIFYIYTTMNSRFCVSIVLFLVMYSFYRRRNFNRRISLNYTNSVFKCPSDDVRFERWSPGMLWNAWLATRVNVIPINCFYWELFTSFSSLTWYHYTNEDVCQIILQKWVCNPIISKTLIWNELQVEPFWVCLVRLRSKKSKK